MPKARKLDHETRRQEILDCAVKILNKKVYYECPVDEIAKKAGIAKGTVYLYFKSKEDIYLSVVFDMIDKFICVVEEAGKMNITASRQLMHMLVQINEFMKTNRYLFLSIREDSHPPKGKVHEEFHLRFGKILNAINVIIQKGIKDREFKDYPPYVVSSLVLAITSIFAHKEFDESSGASKIDPELIVSILMGGLAR